jgi:hypothetical protein
MADLSAAYLAKSSVVYWAEHLEKCSVEKWEQQWVREAVENLDCLSELMMAAMMADKLEA